ncbi:MAG: MerR family transcriptional regulator, partial [Planctomycetaceae bacterium]|nr:MerR family transcriptional regulator [Planctomycetaceae bacterium]
MAEPAPLRETLPAEREPIAGRRVGFLGKLVSMPRREAQDLIRQRGGIPLERLDPQMDLLVIGDHGLPFDPRTGLEQLDAALHEAIDRGAIEVVDETQLWERLGLVEEHRDVHRLYTPTLLAKLLDVPVAVIRRWHRRGLIVPARQVRKLPYFDFQEVATARRLAELLTAGVSAQAIERKLAALARHLPGIERPLAQLSVIVQGSQLLLRQGDGLIEPGGQLRFDFDAARWNPAESRDPPETPGDSQRPDAATVPANPLDRQLAELESESPLGRTLTAHELLQLAEELEDLDDLERAAETYRASLAAGGPHAETC